MVSFDIPKDAEPDVLTVANIGDKNDVFISIKPYTELKSIKSVTIFGYEWNAGKNTVAIIFKTV